MDSTSQYASHPTQDQAPMHRYKVRLWIACCIGFVVFAPLVSAMIGLHLHARDFQYIPDTNLAPLFNGRTVLMELVLLSADPLPRVMTMDWTIIGEENSACSPNNLEACTDIDIYFDKCVSTYSVLICRPMTNFSLVIY